ncbi:hypothetical protein Hanom_Chr15g01336971 [Helianthus anomalus]
MDCEASLKTNSLVGTPIDLDPQERYVEERCTTNQQSPIDIGRVLPNWHQFSPQASLYRILDKVYGITDAQKKRILDALQGDSKAVKAEDQEEWIDGEWEFFHDKCEELGLDPDFCVEDVYEDESESAQFLSQLAKTGKYFDPVVAKPLKNNFWLLLGCYRKLLLFGTFCLLLFGRKVLFLCSQSMISGLGNCCFVNSYSWSLMPGSIQGFGCWVTISYRISSASFDSRVYANLGLFWSPGLQSGFIHQPQLRVMSLGPGLVFVSACIFGASGFSFLLLNSLPLSGSMSWSGFVLGCSGSFLWAASKGGGAAFNFWHRFGLFWCWFNGKKLLLFGLYFMLAQLHLRVYSSVFGHLMSGPVILFSVCAAQCWASKQAQVLLSMGPLFCYCCQGILKAHYWVLIWMVEWTPLKPKYVMVLKDGTGCLFDVDPSSLDLHCNSIEEFVYVWCYTRVLFGKDIIPTRMLKVSRRCIFSELANTKACFGNSLLG